MSKLEEIKDEYAKFENYKDFEEMLCKKTRKQLNDIFYDITKIYAKECVEASLEKSSEKVRLKTDSEKVRVYFSEELEAEIHKESITNKENIILL